MRRFPPSPPGRGAGGEGRFSGNLGIHPHPRPLSQGERGDISLVQQAIEQNLGDDDDDAGIGIDSAVAGDQTDVVGAEAPADSGILHFAEFLFCQCDQRSGVISGRSGVQCLEKSGLSDERLARASRGAHEHALLRGEPGQ